MAITYTVSGGLYINLTNRCGNSCDFCVRLDHSSVGDADTLWLNAEPSVDEVWRELTDRDICSFSEVVFCGFGEPTERLDALLELCGRLKRAYPGVRIRVNTNGQACLIAGKDVTPLFKELVDCVSVSLNYATAEEYVNHCKPVYGPAAFEGLLDFSRKMRLLGIEVVLSVVEGTTDVDAARRLAEQNGLPLRVRTYIDSL